MPLIYCQKKGKEKKNLYIWLLYFGKMPLMLSKKKRNSIGLNGKDYEEPLGK